MEYLLLYIYIYIYVYVYVFALSASVRRLVLFHPKRRYSAIYSLRIGFGRF